MTNTTQSQAAQGKRDPDGTAEDHRISPGPSEQFDDSPPAVTDLIPDVWPTPTFDRLASFRLKQHRTRLGWSQERATAQLRAKAGWPHKRSTFTKLEAGKQAWTIDDLAAVCITFSVTLDQLLLPPKEPDAAWSKVVGRDQFIANAEALTDVYGRKLPTGPDAERAIGMAVGNQVTAVKSHSHIDPPGSEPVDVLSFRDNLAAMLFGVKAQYLESMRNVPRSVYIAELDRLAHLQASLDAAKAAYLELLDGADQEGS